MFNYYKLSLVFIEEGWCVFRGASLLCCSFSLLYPKFKEIVLKWVPLKG